MENLLILHGAIGSKKQFEGISETLKNSFTVHSINFSGHGGEPMPASFSIETFANDVLNYLSKNNITTINIFGYSMGGYVALYLAKHFPKKVNKIFTLATKFNWTNEIAAKEIKMLNAEKISQKIPAFAKLLQERHQPNDWKLVLHNTSNMMVEMGKKNPLTIEEYENIKTPVLIGIGDKDEMVTLEETIAIYRKLPNANLIVLPHTPHPIEKVNIKRLYPFMINFLINFSC